MIDSDAIYNYTGKLKAIQRQFKGKEAKLVSDFLNALSDHGLSKGRITYYACRLPKIMKWFRKRRIALKDATKEDCKQCLRDVNSSGDYGGETKSAYAKTLKRLIHFAKTSEIGEKKEGQDYVQEVAWIRPTAYLKQGEKQEIKPSDILTYQELEMLVEAVNKISRYPVRDSAMVICMYEGAFRSGELLRMAIGGVLFKDKVAVISTTGKTGSKTVPLLLSYKPLLEWLQQHPEKDNPDAAVWMGMTRRKVLHYQYLRNLVKDAARQAGIKKKVWNYLLRHTRLTDVARKHPDQILKKYENWKGNTRMVEVYIHLSESDLEDAVLREHGLQQEEKEEKLTLKKCPRCGEGNTIGVKRCVKCGFIIDEQLAMKTVQEEQDVFGSLSKRIERQEEVQDKILEVLGSIARDVEGMKAAEEDDITTST
ncbi:tyrosine-type recombinase/integrase [Candidatus Nitrososphaera evergladensis]|uniref:tyrosine-type recombinase/integrase n=1 Tax=Candidatus Nitrososphaera evergladensis TaxID=1459637 RepID=UPI00130D9ED8|nr:tyrosine-type recombinase/integrase [Candidatus Nitrososphaera evergladensis]